jgi:hypothetical protein
MHQGFFHWPLEFPEVVADGGFDVVLSNPPWERVKLQEQEFFAARDARIANAPTKAARARLIRELPTTNPQLYREYVEALRAAAGASSLLRHGGRFPLAGRGDINTYAVFAELCRAVIRPGGYCGIIVQSDIATNDTCKFFFQNLIEKRNLVSFYDFVNTEGIFPAVHRTHPHFCLLTMRGDRSRSTPVFSFWNTNTSHLRDENRSFNLTAEEIALLNPNTGNCPIFRTQADAELTKTIYRRVPVLWREAADGQPEANPWRLSFKTLFHMANGSHHFRTANELEADGYRREGNVFVSPYDRYLPLYEAKMLHQFDHRWATYEERESRRTGDWEIEARDVTPQEKNNPAFVVQPRYWVREEVVESTIPKYPEPLAAALQVEHRPSIQHVLTLWATGFHLHRGNKNQAVELLHVAISSDLDRAVARALGTGMDEYHANRLAQDFPLTEDDVQAIAACLDKPESLARDLVERFSPKWFLGWRDITNSTNERTLIASAVPRVAVGNSYPLLFMEGLHAKHRLSFEAMANSFVVDYVARQKVGGTHINYFYLKQFPLLSPTTFEESTPFSSAGSMVTWLVPRVLELVYTAHDHTHLALDCGYNGPPFPWDDERRLEIRCELDAAFFHLYLPCEPDGSWRTAEGETAEQLAALKHHFPQPSDAVAYILDQFPIVRQKDEDAHGSYRTKERILEIYDAMVAAQCSGRPYQTTLNPPPGSRSSHDL